MFKCIFLELVFVFSVEGQKGFEHSVLYISFISSGGLSIFLVMSRGNMPSRAATAIQLVSPSWNRETVIDVPLVECLNAIGKKYFHSFDTCLFQSAD